MGVQGYLPKSPESVIYSNPIAFGKRPLLQNLQSNDVPAAFHRSPCRSVALAVGGGLSLSAWTAINWLGRKSRRQQRSLRRASSAVASPIARSQVAKQLEGVEALDATSCMSCLDRKQKSILDVQYLYASPILRPGSSSERLPPLRWQEEVAAVREALEIDADIESGSSVERDGTPLSVSASSMTRSSNGTARMQVLVATVNTLSRLAANCSPSGPRWWHIAAHSEPGGTGRLILEDEDGAPQVVSMSALFECQTPPLGVSVLACDGEQAGRALLDAGASFAIVATGQLRDSTARMFTSHFYRRLHCACRSLETFDSLHGGLSPQVHLAFRAAKEALKTAANAAIRADATQLMLIEKGSVSPAPLGRSCNVWVPVAMSPETQGSIRQEVLGEDMEEDPIPLPELPVSTCSSRSLPQDCEDFLGRGGDLQSLMQQLGAPRGRRVIVLHGPCGIGKSAISAELCRFATAPGRRFAPVKGKHRLAYVSLQNSSMDSETGTEACAQISIFAAAAGLASSGRSCLLIDRAEKQFGWRDEFVPEVLDKHPQLCLLITRRSPLYRLDGEGGDRWKPVNIALGPLPDVEAAQLFLQRLHRPLFPSDLWPAAKAAAAPLRPNENLLRRIASLPALIACGGLPRLVVRLAAQVTWELPSLLDLQPEWLKVESVSHGTGNAGSGLKPPSHTA